MCWNVLRRANEILEPTLREMYGDKYIDDESHLPFIIGYIFAAEVDSKEAAELLMPKRSGAVASVLLAKAAAVIDSFIETGYTAVMTGILKARYGIVVVDDNDDDDDDQAQGM